MRTIGIFIAIILIFSSCKKAEDRKCFKGTGEEVTVEIELQSFDKLFLGAHINFILVQDSVEKVVLTGGENLVNFIGTDIVNGKLRITNDNKCNFLRTHKKSVTVEVHLIDIKEIKFEGTRRLTCKNVITCPKLLIIIKDGAGEFNLNVNNDVLRTNISNGWGNMVISGTTKYANFGVKSNGFLDSYGLTIQDSIHVNSNTPGTTMINADNVVLRSETASSGDIWYVGTPTLIDHNQYGTGELIDKN